MIAELLFIAPALSAPAQQQPLPLPLPKEVKGKPAMIVDLHGSTCGKTGYMACPKTLFWNGKTFAKTL